MAKIMIKPSRKSKKPLTTISRVRSHENISKLSKKKKKKPKKRQNYPPGSVEKARCALQNGMSFKDVHDQYGIPITTCYDIKNQKYKTNTIGHSTYLGRDVEIQLVNAIIQLSKWGFGLNTLQLQMIVKDYLDSTKITNKFKNNTPERKWFVLFRNRHPSLSIRVAQSFPKNRAESLNENLVENFYKIVKENYDELDLHDKPTHIFNADETGFSGDSGRQMVLCKKGIHMKF